VQQWTPKARAACEHAMRPWIQYIRTFNVSTYMYACLRYSVRLSRRILRQTEKEGEMVLLAWVEASELGSDTGFIVTNLPGGKSPLRKGLLRARTHGESHQGQEALQVSSTRFYTSLHHHLLPNCVVISTPMTRHATHQC
jgi:hypothetical protein